MTRAYAEIYKENAEELLGSAFYYAASTCGIKADIFSVLFNANVYAARIEQGDPAVIIGMTGPELAISVITSSGLKMQFKDPKPAAYSRSAEYQLGRILVYYQWRTGYKFRNITNKLPVSELISLITKMNDCTEEEIAEKMDGSFAEEKHVLSLQERRKAAGLSQSRLAKLSGVNLRTLQQYEIGGKNIKKAAAITVKALAGPLGCTTDDLIG